MPTQIIDDKDRCRYDPADVVGKRYHVHCMMKRQGNEEPQDPQAADTENGNDHRLYALSAAPDGGGENIDKDIGTIGRSKNP